MRRNSGNICYLILISKCHESRLQQHVPYWYHQYIFTYATNCHCGSYQKHFVLEDALVKFIPLSFLFLCPCLSFCLIPGSFYLPDRCGVQIPVFLLFYSSVILSSQLFLSISFPFFYTEISSISLGLVTLSAFIRASCGIAGTVV